MKNAYIINNFEFVIKNGEIARVRRFPKQKNNPVGDGENMKTTLQ